MPGTPHEAAPMLKTWETESVNSTGAATSSDFRSVPAWPGAATKKSMSVERSES